jgi:hypothetical protein
MAKKPSRENKKLTELGQIGRSGRLISQYIRGIGTEKTELILNPVTGKSEVVSKGEALARKSGLRPSDMSTTLTPRHIARPVS